MKKNKQDLLLDTIDRIIEKVEEYADSDRVLEKLYGGLHIIAKLRVDYSYVHKV